MRMLNSTGAVHMWVTPWAAIAAYMLAMVGADTDVDAVARRHAPREGPAVAVEHGELSQVHGLVAEAPLDHIRYGAEVGADIVPEV
jgi:hypothetical protein